MGTIRKMRTNRMVRMHRMMRNPMMMRDRLMMNHRDSSEPPSWKQRSCYWRWLSSCLPTASAASVSPHILTPKLWLRQKKKKKEKNRAGPKQSASSLQSVSKVKENNNKKHVSKYFVWRGDVNRLFYYILYSGLQKCRYMGSQGLFSPENLCWQR